MIFRCPQFSVQPNRHKCCDNSRNDICNRLCVENTTQSQNQRKYQNDGDKANSLAASAQDTALCGFPHHKEQEGEQLLGKVLKFFPLWEIGLPYTSFSTDKTDKAVKNLNVLLHRSIHDGTLTNLNMVDQLINNRPVQYI